MVENGLDVVTALEKVAHHNSREDVVKVRVLWSESERALEYLWTSSQVLGYTTAEATA